VKENESFKASEVEEFYNDFASRQKEAGVNQRHRMIMHHLKNAGLSRNHHVLEIGCGIGTLTSLLVPWLHTGTLMSVDISPESIKIAREHLKHYSNLTLIHGDIIETDIDQAFDVVILPDVLEHIPVEHHRSLFAKISGLLKSDGFVFINIPNPEYLAWCHIHKKELLQIIDQPLYPNELLQNIYANNLIVTNLTTYSVWVRDGDYQYLVLKKKGVEDFNVHIEEKVSIWEKIKYKLNAKKQ
jgi:2-polyprenyl-3-methyl-5-hydroxy-6-metoxy-1,4-benzoquinol methylase